MNDVAVLNDLLERATACHRAGDLAAAAALYRETLARAPYQFDALYLLGVIEAQQGNAAEAVALLTRALALNPHHPAALVTRGNAYLSLDQAEPGLADFDTAIAAMSPYIAALNSRGGALQMLGRLEDAVQCFSQALALAPDHPPYLANRGAVLLELGRTEQALADLERATALDPSTAPNWHNRGNALRALGRLDEALASFDKALALEPGYPDALTSRGATLIQLQQVAEAQASLRRALAHRPTDMRARYNAAIADLLAGDLRQGFAGYEARWHVPPNSAWRRDFPQPLWLGNEEIAGRTILLHAEQGHGDTIQFCRYAPLVAARGARVILEVQPALKTLMADLDGVATVVGHGEALPAFDLHCPLMSLPRAFGTMLTDIPAKVPYLTADPARRAGWLSRLGQRPLVRLGVVCSGNPQLPNDRNRSIPLAAFAPLLGPGVEAILLQNDLRPADRSWLAQQGGVRDMSSALQDFADTAALMDLVDVVVSVDTAAAHLAGALGKPTFILLPFIGVDWRWMTERSDTPWYPTARLLRQPTPGDWRTPIAAVAAEIARLGAG